MLDTYFKFLVQLYPRRFRQLYGQEILHVIRADKPNLSLGRRISSGLITTCKTLPWIAKEHIDAFSTDFARTPTFIKYEYALGILLTAPFFLIVAHNLIQLSVWHSVSPLFISIGNAWIAYTIITPIIAVLLSLAGLVWYMKKQFHPAASPVYEAGVVPSGSLVVIVGTIAAALVAIF